MAGGAGLVAILEHFSSKEKERFERKQEKMRLAVIEDYKKQYPSQDAGKIFDLVFSPILSQADRVYILDKKTNMRYWVGSRQTFDDLGFSWDAIKEDKFGII